MLSQVVKDKLLWVLMALLLVMFILSIVIGSVHIPWSAIFIWHDASASNYQQILWQYRLPRALTAMLTGVALPISGWILQEYFRNPLAGPSILGVTSSAGLGVALLIVAGGSLGFYHWIDNSWAITLAGLLGALSSMMLLLWASSYNFSTTALIILGFMMAAFSGALIGILSYMATESELKSYILWTFGSISGLSYERIIYFAIATLLGLLIVIKNIPALIKIQLGEMYASTMGVNIKGLRLQLIIAASILTGVCTALVGPIAFIGLAVPHICRTYLKTSNFYLLFAHILVVGMLLMLAFTLIAVIFPRGALPINIITSLLGAPMVLHIIIHNKNLGYG